MSTKDHYVINIDIKHVEFPGPNEAERRGARPGTEVNARFVSDVAHMVMTAATKYDAIKKIMEHLQVEKEEEVRVNNL